MLLQELLVVGLEVGVPRFDGLQVLLVPRAVAASQVAGQGAIKTRLVGLVQRGRVLCVIRGRAFGAPCAKAQRRTACVAR